MKTVTKVQPYDSFNLTSVKKRFDKTNKPNEKVFLKKTKWDEIKEVFLEWSFRSNLDCFVKIFEYKDNPFAKYLWIIILVLLSGITFWSIVKIIFEYFNYEVVSKFTVTYENPTKFPTITICNNNPFTTNNSQILFETIAKTANLSPYDPNVFRFAKMKASSPTLNEEKKRALGFDLPNKLMTCLFGGQECNASDFKWYWSFDYGNCWQFNSGFSKLTNSKIEIANGQSGIEFGLQMAIYPLENKNKYPSTSDMGLVVFVHNNTFRPLRSDSIFIKPSEKTHILVKRIFTHKVPFPYSECRDLNGYSSRLYDFILSNNRTYRQQDCVYLCFQEISIEKCGCIFSAFEDTAPNIKFCMNKTEGFCFKDLYFSFRPDECVTNSCPLECDSVEYSVEVSSLSSPSIQGFNCFFKDSETNRGLTYDLYKSQMVQLNIYYSSLHYTTISESVKITGFELFSQIGGTLGCFVSLSLFTLFEFIEIFILILNVCFFKSRK